MDFLDFIFDNIFIVAIVVIGLFNLLTGMGKKNAQEKKQAEQKPVNQPSKPLGRMERAPQGFEERIENVGRKVEQKLEDYAQRFDVDTSSTKKTIEEQRQEQYDRLKKNIQSGQGIPNRSQRREQPHRSNDDNVVTEMESMPVVKHHKKTEVSALKLEEKLTARGLIDSVIMAEVLGPPRAQNPYQNIAAKRKRR